MAVQKLEAVSRERAVEAFQRVPDPTGQSTPEDLAAGDAFELHATGGSGVFSLERQGNRLWVTAAAGRSDDDLTRIGLDLIEETARQAGCLEVGFQTARPGLVKKATQQGYEVAGWILKKAV
ncbi:MAG: hypothetical protein U5M53_13745 [Rhodoferax sp.]|nr:hypothetical protein [Rhodoferax sp.]